MRGERPPLAIQVVLLGKHLDHLLEHRLANRGLNRTQAVVLTVLSHHPGLQAIDLCPQAGSTPANVTRTVQSLERLGLLQRRPHPSDGRANLFFLTDAGHMLARELSEEIQRLSASLLQEVDPEDLPHVEGILAGLWKAVHRRLIAISRQPSAIGYEPMDGERADKAQAHATEAPDGANVMSRASAPKTDADC
ncbi:MAG: MarR family winged helix-turn-helix transcriptional regulator [Sphingomonadaceae bacterium]